MLVIETVQKLNLMEHSRIIKMKNIEENEAMEIYEELFNYSFENQKAMKRKLKVETDFQKCDVFHVRLTSVLLFGRTGFC